MNRYNNPLVDFLMLALVVFGVLMAGLYFTGNIHCWNFFGLTKGCVIG